MKRVLLLAGEESGMMYAREIAARLRERCPGLEIRGYADGGFETGDLAVFGIFAVLRKIGYFMRVKRTMMRMIDEWRPEVVGTIDYPGMNLRLAAYAKSQGIRTVHVVCPQVWAWHQGRIPKIEAALDRLCCFFPFEPKIFRDGFATFVGHPLAGLGADGGGDVASEGVRTVAILPGSRIGEIERILPRLLQVVARLRGCHSDLRFVIPAASSQARRQIERLVGASGEASNVAIQDGGARELLGRATCAVVASGTATLEAALMKCPTVLVYRVGAITAAIARRVIKGVRHVGLANIVAEKAGVECPMPELLQEDFTVEAVVNLVSGWLENESSRIEAREKLGRTMRLLRGEGDPLGRIADEMTGESR